MKIIHVKDIEDVPKKFTGIAICSVPLGTVKVWSLRGMIHRLDGPAVEWNTGEKQYFVLTKNLSMEEFEIFQRMWERTLLDKTEELMRTFVKLIKMK